jgi:phosphoribosyl-AMP cyclohydrolase
VIDIDFKKGDGLVPVIVQDHETGEVLMLAYMNDLSWKKTLETGKATYWSRSRNELWVKGETSGHVQLVKEILVDCDADTLLLKVSQVGGAACHTGYRSCFYRRVSNEVTEVIGELVFKPEDVYK